MADDSFPGSADPGHQQPSDESVPPTYDQAGAPLPPPPEYSQVQYGPIPAQTNPMLIAAFALSMLAFAFTFFYGLGLFCGFLAIILGHISRAEQKAHHQNLGLANATLIIGYSYLVFVTLWACVSLSNFIQSSGTWIQEIH